MTEMKPHATLIGDVVGSRTSTSRAGLHRALVDLLDRVNRATAPLSPLRITVGDEYQGSFATLGEALAAAAHLQLLALPRVDLRHGIGWGTTQTLSTSPPVEDGPGWWAAREAIEYVATQQRRAAHRTLRSAFRTHDPSDTAPDPAVVNAALLARDTLIGSLDDRSLSVLRGLLAGMSQTEIAVAEEISPSAVSQRVRRDGLAVIVDVIGLLGQAR